MTPSRPTRHLSLSVFAVLLASCLGPPAVTPTQTLTIGGAESGPRTRGAFAVVFAGPRGTVANRSEPGVTVLFNHSMRSLDDDDQARIPPVTVRTEAGVDVAGSWRWVGMHGLLFVPDSDLPGGTRFRVTVPKTTRSVEGESLAGDYSFVFATPRPRVLASEPAEGLATLRPDATIRVYFNQHIDPGELAKATHLSVRDADGRPARPVPFSVTRLQPQRVPTPRSLLDTEIRADRAMLITPNARLPLDAAVEVVVDEGLVGEGPLSMQAPVRLHVRTYGPLRLDKVTCPRVFDTKLGKCQAHRDITLALSNPVMPDEFTSHVALGRLPKAPPVKAMPKNSRPRAESEYAIGADPDFNKRYRVTLKAGMTDIYGQRLAKDIAVDIDTEPPFLQGQKPTGMRNAPSDDSEGSAASDDSSESEPSPTPPNPHDDGRPIPPFEIGLGITGTVLEARTQHHAVPVGFVNVPTFGVIARSVDAREGKQWLAGVATSPGGFLSGGHRFRWETPDPTANTRLVRWIDLDAILAPTGTGAALLAVGTPRSTTPEREHLVSVTDLGVTAKMSKFGSLVWVTSLSTGKPVPGAQVTVGHLKKDDGTTFVTDERGIALVPPDAFSPVIEARARWGNESGAPDASWALVVRHGDDWTTQRVEESPSFRRAVPRIVDLAATKGWLGSIFSDRGIYRPGETVKLAAVVRQADARGLVAAESRDVRVTVTDAQDNKVFESRGNLDAFGGLAIDAPIPKTAHLGSAMASVTLGSKGESFSTRVLLAEFKPAEFNVTARADKKELVRGDVAHFTVHGEYLFLAPMANAAGHDTAVRSDVSFAPKGSEGYVTSDEVFTSDYGDKKPRAGELVEKDVVLDAHGDEDESIDLVMPGQRHTERISFESEIEDFTRQVVTGFASLLVHPAEFYIGIRRSPSSFVAVGATLSPDILAIHPDGTRVAGAAVKLELVERKWLTVVQDEGEGSRKSTLQDTTVAACDVVTASAPRS